MAAGAELLNDKFDALSARFDRLKSVPKDKAALVNASIAGWQDWFWGNHGGWDSTGLLEWQDKYVKTAALVDALAKKTVIVKDYTETDDYDPTPTWGGTLPPLLITAKPPEPAYVAPKPVVYQERPYVPAPAPKPVQMSMGTIDTSGWGKTSWAPMVSYSRDPGTTAWTLPTDTGVSLNRNGLAAAMVAVGVAILGKKQGWL